MPKVLPAYVQREFYVYLQCGILAHGFLRLGCDTCKHEMLLAFSCKRRGFCPSCAGRRMAQTAAHLVERVIPWVPTRQWVVSVPDALAVLDGVFTGPDRDRSIRSSAPRSRQYYVNQAVTRGAERQKVATGVGDVYPTLWQCAQCERAFSCDLSLRGSISIAPTQGRKPRFVKGEPPSDADIAAVVQTISRRVIRKLRHLGYLEALRRRGHRV